MIELLGTSVFAGLLLAAAVPLIFTDCADQPHPDEETSE